MVDRGSVRDDVIDLGPKVPSGTRGMLLVRETILTLCGE